MRSEAVHQVYRATHAGLALRIYFLSHHETSEEQRLLVGVRREKEAFERLINERGVCNVSTLIYLAS